MKYIVLSFLIIAFIKLNSQNNVIIKGIAKSYGQEKIVAKIIKEHILYSETELANAIINEDGSFNISFNVEGTTLVKLYLGNLYSNIYVTKDESYNVIFPNKDSIPAEIINFSPLKNIEIKSTVYNKDNSIDELNNKIKQIDDEFYRFTKQFQNKYADDKKVPLDDFNKIYKSIKVNNPYFSIYSEYKYFFIELYLRKKRDDILVKEYFHERPILYDNDQYMNTFNEFFSNYLKKSCLNNEYGKNIIESINTYENFDSIVSAFKGDNLIKDKNLFELIVLKGLYEVFYDEAYNQPSIIKILNGYLNKTNNESTKIIAKEIINKISATYKGNTAPLIKLPDINNKLINIREYDDKLVYLMFFESLTPIVTEDLFLIKEMYNKYNKNVEFISVCPNSIKKQLNKLISNNGLEWTFILTSNNSIYEQYHISNYPSYFLLDKSNKFISAPSKSPTEGVDNIFNAMFNKKDKEIEKGGN